MSGIFSAIGTGIGTAIGGPQGGAIGGSLGGAIDDKKAAKEFNHLEKTKFVRLRAAAERGGFHPLEALRSGQQVGARSTRLFSSLSASNAFDALEDELTGEGAKQRKREQVEDEIRERELDKQRYDVAQQTINQPSTKRTSPRLPPSSSVEGGEANDSVPAGVSSISALPENDDSRLLADPNRVDFGGLAERWGESEIIEALAFPVNMGFDMAYSSRVTDIANASGQTRMAIHAQIAEGGPSAARQLYNDFVINRPNPRTGNSPLSAEFWRSKKPKTIAIDPFGEQP